MQPLLRGVCRLLKIRKPHITCTFLLITPRVERSTVATKLPRTERPSVRLHKGYLASTVINASLHNCAFRINTTLVQETWPSSLNEFTSSSATLCLDRSVPDWVKRAEVALETGTRLGMTPKKAHEVPPLPHAYTVPPPHVEPNRCAG